MFKLLFPISATYEISMLHMQKSVWNKYDVSSSYVYIQKKR